MKETNSGQMYWVKKSTIVSNKQCTFKRKSTLCLINSIHSYYDTSIPISSLRYFRHVGIPFGRESVVFVATYCYYIQGNMNRFFFSCCILVALASFNVSIHSSTEQFFTLHWMSDSCAVFILNLTFAQCQCLSKWISPHLGKNSIQFHFFCLHFIGFGIFFNFFCIIQYISVISLPFFVFFLNKRIYFLKEKFYCDKKKRYFIKLTVFTLVSVRQTFASTLVAR